MPAGVDVNPTHREHVQRLGLSCYSPEEVQALDARWDAILMAHVIEHFSPAELLKFLDSYLDRLSERGFLVIATPTDWPRFLADFDHVRAYYPESLLQVFGDEASQLQYHARNRLAPSTSACASTPGFRATRRWESGARRESGRERSTRCVSGSRARRSC